MRKISYLTSPHTLQHEIAVWVEELNVLIRGWGNYFCLGPVSEAYRSVDGHARYRLLWRLCKKHKKRGRGTGCYLDEYLYESLGLIRLESTPPPVGESMKSPWAESRMREIRASDLMSGGVETGPLKDTAPPLRLYKHSKITEHCH